MVNRNFGLMGQNRQWGLGRRHPPRHSDQPIAIWGWRPNFKKNPKINLPNCSIFGFSLENSKNPTHPTHVVSSRDPYPKTHTVHCTTMLHVWKCIENASRWNFWHHLSFSASWRVEESSSFGTRKRGSTIPTVIRPLQRALLISHKFKIAF